MSRTHPHNLYSTTRIQDANVSDSTDAPELSSINQYPFYLMEIVPVNLGVDLVCAGNFTIDGLSSSWVWDAANGNGDLGDECNPPNPPWAGAMQGQHVAHSTPHNINMVDSSPLTQGFYNCYGAYSNDGTDFNGNDARPHQGPFQLHNMAYIGGDFVGSGNPVTWFIVILIDVYELNDGTLVNDNLSPSVEENLALWTVGNNYDLANMKHNGHPVKVKAFVMPHYNPLELDNLQPGLLNEVEFDLDYIIPTTGCVDANADNYDPLAQISDLSSCTYPGTTYTVSCYDAGNVTGTTGDLGVVGVYTEPPFASEVPAWDVFSGINQRDLNSVPAMPKNLLIGNGPMPGTFYSANQYLAGDVVDEIIELTLKPRRESYSTGLFDNNGVEIFGTAIAIYDFPDSGGPNGQSIDPMFLNPGENDAYFVDGALNLTAGSIYINNYNADDQADVGRGQYVPMNQNGNITSNTITSQQPQWMPDGGVYGTDGVEIPSTLVEWDVDSLECVQLDGSIFDIGETQIWAEEIFTTSPNSLSRYPATEYWPVKVKLYLQVYFTMPASNVQIKLDLVHDTTRVGISPI